METQSPSTYLEGFAIRGYRSIRSFQAVGPLSKVTLVAGRNNSGKSNILRFVSEMLRAQPAEREWFDKPTAPEGPELAVEILRPIPEDGPNAKVAQSLAAVWRSSPMQRVSAEGAWIRYSLDKAGRGWILDESFLEEVRSANSSSGSAIRAASSDLTGSSGGQPVDDIRRVLEKLFPFRAPRVESVEAFRQISSGEDSEDANHSGRNLIEQLVRLKDPDPEHFDAERARFEAISRFAQTVFDDPSVEIQIPADRKTIAVKHEGRTLPLSSLGTGIHQVIVLAAAASVLENTLVCIEEPEVHLHPILQRKLIRYLNEETNNQYLIATHSAHMLDYERAAVFHVRHDPTNGTTVSPAVTPQDVSEICGDLGYRASDLLQANAVIWVEGPSDRIYLRHWIEKLAPDEFVEGIHYSIMFYGGTLLRHLSADDRTVSDFISLRRLNRYSAIVIDSDRATARARINETKRRVKEEFDQESMPGFAWITECRTIENYLPQALLSEAVAAVHPSPTYVPPATKWDEPLQLHSSTTNAKVAASKVRIAHEACSRWDAELDKKLADRVRQAVAFIRLANEDPVRSPAPISSE